MLWVLSVLGLISLIGLGAGWYVHRPGPPPARQGDLVVDWTRQWRRALDSLDRPLPGERPSHAQPRLSKRPDSRLLSVVRR